MYIMYQGFLDFYIILAKYNRALLIFAKGANILILIEIKNVDWFYFFNLFIYLFIYFFENFAINLQINVSFKREYVSKDIQQKWILTKKTMALSHCFS